MTLCEEWQMGPWSRDLTCYMVLFEKADSSWQCTPVVTGRDTRSEEIFFTKAPFDSQK